MIAINVFWSLLLATTLCTIAIRLHLATGRALQHTTLQKVLQDDH
ncbi:hypothetical protein [Iningainema tapete]|nr:hypothetical protein [Iningainema tapete]